MTGEVEAESLTKEFRVLQRREGWRGALQGLVSRPCETVRAVDQLAFRIQRGEMVGYIGPNGAGKTTTIRLLTGILEPTAGRTVVNGFVPYRERTQYTRTIGVVSGHRTQLWWDIAVAESLRVLQHLYEVSDFDYTARLNLFDQILEVKRHLDTPARDLSPGERIRCELAASLLHNPAMLFLDEPSLGLDMVARTVVRAFVKEIHQRFGVTVLLTTHDLSDVEELCRRLMIIDHGCILFDGALAALRQQLWQKMQVKIELKEPGQAPALESLALNNMQRQRLDQFTYLYSFDREQHKAAELVRQIVAAVEVRDIFIEEEPIEEIVRRIYTGPKTLEFGG